MTKARSETSGKKVLLSQWQQQELRRILLQWPGGTRIKWRTINNRATFANCDYHGLRVEGRAILRHLFKAQSKLRVKDKVVS